MKHHSLPRWALPILATALLLALACNAIVWSQWDPTLIMNDGIGYLSTAANWLKGKGFSTNAPIYIPHFEGRMPARETVWPIGYPAAIAIASYTGLSLQKAALALNLFAHFLSAILVFVILRRCHVNRASAIVAAIVFYFTTEGWFLAVTLLSEPLFTLFVLTTLAVLPNTTDFSLRRLLFCAVLLALATTIRYSAAITAVSFAAGMGLVCLWQSRRAGLARLIGQTLALALFTLVSLGGYAALQLRIYNISGNIDRDTGTGEIHSVADTVYLFAEQSSVLTGFRDGSLFQGDIDKWTFFAFVFAIALFALFALFTRPNHAASSHSQHHSAIHGNQYTKFVVWAIIMHTLLYAGYLFYCRVSESPLPVSARYLYQLYPGLLIIFALLANRVLVNRSTLGSFRTLPLATMAALFALFATAQVNLIGALDEFTQRGDDAANVLQLQLSSETTSNETRVADLINRCVGDSRKRAIWSNEGVMLHGSTGANTVTYTAIYANRPFDFGLLQRQIRDYEIAIFMFLGNRIARDGQYAEKLQDAKDWLTANQYRSVPLQADTVASGTSLEVFIDEAACSDNS